MRSSLYSSKCYFANAVFYSSSFFFSFKYICRSSLRERFGLFCYSFFLSWILLEILWTTTTTSACDSKIINDLHSNELNKSKKKAPKILLISKLIYMTVIAANWFWFKSVTIDERMFRFDPLFWNIVIQRKSNEKKARISLDGSQSHSVR